MGKNNRNRRAAKAKKRREQARERNRRHQHQHQGGETSPPTDPELVMGAVDSYHRQDGETLQILVGHLLARPDRRVAAELQHLLELQTSWIWEGGWQPTDLIRVTAKKLSAGDVDLLRCALADAAAGYEQLGVAVAPEWMAQLDEHDAIRWWDPSRPWPLQIGGAWPDVLVAGIRLLNLLGSLPGIPVLTSPPSRWALDRPAGEVPVKHLAPETLATIRKLLAKAESTPFEAEAEALTAKAQELMTRHRIDRAIIGDGDHRQSGEVVGRRVGIDDPYADAKAVLLAGIAQSNGSRAVWSKDFGFSTVFAFPEDLEGVEELFTSLLVQADVALRREGSKRDRLGRSRTTRFRRSFLVAFANRIGQRLRDTTFETIRVVEGETASLLLPMLASRARAADDAVDQAFPDLTQFKSSATDREGYISGTRLADEADLSTAASSPPQPRFARMSDRV